VRKPGSKKGAVVGTGGQRSKGLQGKGPTPKAQDRTGHPAARRAAAAERAAASGSAPRGGASRGGGVPGSQPAGRTGDRSTGRGGGRAGDRGTGRTGGQPGRAGGRRGSAATEVVAGRNAVVEALRAGVPVKALLVASRVDSDDRVKEALSTVAELGVPLLEASRTDLDRITGGAVHQGLVLQVPAYDYAHPADLLDAALAAGQAPLLVALDGVTDPRNLGAIIRSTAAFGGHGVVIPERRSAGMTAAAWKASAGAAARLPVARAANLTRTLVDLQKAGCFAVGLDADADLTLPDLDVATGPIVLVVGSEGRGLSRLVRETCDLVAAIPMAAGTESLNAGVAAGVALYQVARHRSPHD